MCSEYVEARRGRRGNVFEAPQAVSAEEFGKEISPELRRHARMHAGAPGEGGFLALFVGRLVREKGVRVLLDAWRRADLGEGVGAGPRRRGAAAAEAAGGAGRARRSATCRATSCPALYAAADVLVLPSIRTATFLEPWGLVVNEAMHQGTPVDSQRCGGRRRGRARAGRAQRAGRRRRATRRRSPPDCALWPRIRICERVSGPRHARTSPRSHTLPGSRGCGRHLSPWVRFVRDDLASLVIERPVRAHFFESAAHSQRPVQQLWDCWAGEPQS